jgi:hypothetical protein
MLMSTLQKTFPLGRQSMRLMSRMHPPSLLLSPKRRVQRQGQASRFSGWSLTVNPPAYRLSDFV